MKRVSRVIGPVILICCLLFMFLHSLSFQRRDSLFPQGLMIALFILVLMFTVSRVREKRGDDTTQEPAKQGWYRIWATILLTIAYIFICNGIGYWFATVVFVFALLLILGERNWIVVSVLPVVITLMIYVVFYRFLHIPLPEGKLF